MQTDTQQQASYAHQETNQTTCKPQIPAILQETNYSMQTAEATTTSTAPCSEAEESMVIDDNDDWLS
jgi:hypothetical protein